MIRMEIPFLPPSANHAYFNLPKGGRTLTKKGKKFKKEAAVHIIRHYSSELMMFQQNVPYGIAVRFFFPNLQNKTWPESAASRYKRIDTSNRIKLLEDVLADVAAVDDSQHMVLMLGKSEAKEEKTIVWAWDLLQEQSDVCCREFLSMQ